MVDRSFVALNEDRAWVEMMVRGGEPLSLIDDYLRCINVCAEGRESLRRLARSLTHELTRERRTLAVRAADLR
jgi:hypothetical protein